MTTKKSPLKDKPLRHAGQSLDEEINKLIEDDALLYISISALMIVLSMLEWYRWYFQLPPSPYIFTFFALLIIGFSTYKITNIRKKIKSLKLGRDGEKAVGQSLENLRSHGSKILHDIRGKNFNIDHVVISTKGIYLIETKTYSKPIKGKTEIVFNGQQLLFNGVSYGDDIIIQVKAEKKWLSDLIEELTARKYPVQPILVFPGWFVKMENAFSSGISALNPDNLHVFLNNKQEVMSPEDVQLVSNHLSRYIRSLEK